MKGLKFQVFILSLFLASLILGGCRLIPQLKKEEQVTLKYWGLWESASTLNSVIADFKKEHANIDVIYEKRSPPQYRESLVTQVEKGTGPDIFLFHNTWTPILP